VPNSENHKLVLTLHELSSKGLEVSEEASRILSEWKLSTPPQSSPNFAVLLRYLLMSLEKEEDRAKVKELIRHLDSITERRCDGLARHSKPVLLAAGDEFKEDSENKIRSELTSAVDPNLLLDDLARQATQNPNLINSVTDSSILVHIDLAQASKDHPNVLNKIFSKQKHFGNLQVSS
jgi:hypothetical protein